MRRPKRATQQNKEWVLPVNVHSIDTVTLAHIQHPVNEVFEASLTRAGVPAARYNATLDGDGKLEGVIQKNTNSTYQSLLVGAGRTLLERLDKELLPAIAAELGYDLLHVFTPATDITSKKRTRNLAAYWKRTARQLGYHEDHGRHYKVYRARPTTRVA